MPGESGNGKKMTISFNVMRWLLPIVFGSGIAWAMVKDVPKNQAAMAVKIAESEKKVAAAEVRMAKIEAESEKNRELNAKDMSYIKTALDEIRIEVFLLRGRWRKGSILNYQIDHPYESP